jgi:hypothetical protein
MGVSSHAAQRRRPTTGSSIWRTLPAPSVWCGQPSTSSTREPSSLRQAGRIQRGSSVTTGITPRAPTSPATAAGSSTSQASPGAPSPSGRPTLAIRPAAPAHRRSSARLRRSRPSGALRTTLTTEGSMVAPATRLPRSRRRSKRSARARGTSTSPPNTRSTGSGRDTACRHCSVLRRRRDR